MKYIILCDNYSLQFIQCRHIIEYIIESISLYICSLAFIEKTIVVF